MQLECTAELAADLASWARDSGIRAVLNPAPARPLPPDALASFDIITPNEGELRTLTASLGLADAATAVLAQQLLGYGIGDVVVTLGERGALWASAAGLRHFDAYPVHAIDTTGPATHSAPGSWPRWSAASRWNRRSTRAAGPAPSA